MDPRYEQLSIGGYNEFVEYYNNKIKTAAEEKGIAAAEYTKSFLTKVADGLYLETEGDPFGYYRDNVSGGINPVPEKYGESMALNKVAGISSTEYSISKSEGHEKEMSHGFSFDLTVKFGFNAGFARNPTQAAMSACSICRAIPPLSPTAKVFPMPVR